MLFLLNVFTLFFSGISLLFLAVVCLYSASAFMQDEDDGSGSGGGTSHSFDLSAFDNMPFNRDSEPHGTSGDDGSGDGSGSGSYSGDYDYSGDWYDHIDMMEVLDYLEDYLWDYLDGWDTFSDDFDIEYVYILLDYDYELVYHLLMNETMEELLQRLDDLGESPRFLYALHDEYYCMPGSVVSNLNLLS